MGVSSAVVDGPESLKVIRFCKILISSACLRASFSICRRYVMIAKKMHLISIKIRQSLKIADKQIRDIFIFNRPRTIRVSLDIFTFAALRLAFHRDLHSSRDIVTGKRFTALPARYHNSRSTVKSPTSSVLSL
jgi:hypothetical protein